MLQRMLQGFQSGVRESKDVVAYGPVAQWIRHLTTNQGIAGSSPARINTFSNSSRMYFSLLDMKCQSLTIKGDMTAEIAGS